MADEQYVLADGAAPHYHDGEPVGTEPFVPSDAERQMLGDLLVPVRGNGDDGSNENEDGPETTDTDNGTDTGNGTDTDNDDDLTDLDGVGPAMAEALRGAGFEDFDALDDATVEDLAGVGGVSRSLAESIKEQVGG